MLARKLITHLLLISMIALISPAHASATAAQAPAPAASTDKTIYSCPVGFERLLPGEYYACRARYHFQRQHYSQMMGTLEEAAHWASKNAQYTLGMIYLNGDVPGIPANRPLAIAWLALAAERKDPTYLHMYSLACLRSTPAQLRAGAELFRKMSLEYGDKVAGKLAVLRFNREIRPMEDVVSGGGLFYLSGYSPYPERGAPMIVFLHGMADQFFEGLNGTVTVGALQTRFSSTPPAAPAR